MLGVLFMRAVIVIVAVALAGCSSNTHDNAVEPSSGKTTTTTAPPSKVPPSSSPPPTSNPTPPTAITPTTTPPTPPPGQTRTVNKSFELNFADAGGMIAPPQNCVVIESANMRVHDGTARAESQGSPRVGQVELRMASQHGNATAKGDFPIALDIPPTELIQGEQAMVFLQVNGASLVKATLTVTLEITGTEPAFTVAGCRAGS